MRKILYLTLAVLVVLCFTAYASDPSEWAKEEVQIAVDAGYVPESLFGAWQEDISRADFARLAVNFVAYNLGFWHGEFTDYVCANTDIALFDDTDFPYVQLAARLGITKGTGDGRFLPYEKITREQAATMLERVYLLYSNSASLGKGLGYSDDDEISAWAKYSVMFCKNYGIMQGVSEEYFNPQGTYTSEQAVATFVRLGNITEWRAHNFGARFRRKMTRDEVIAEYESLEWQEILNRIDTSYGTVLYMVTGGVPHPGSHSLILIDNNGFTYNLSADVPPDDGWGKTPELGNISMSEDGKYLTYQVKFESSAESADAGVLHEAGTYYFEADLEEGKCKFLGRE